MNPCGEVVKPITLPTLSTENSTSVNEVVAALIVFTGFPNTLETLAEALEPPVFVLSNVIMLSGL